MSEDSTLYHYTTLQALSSIVSKRELWLSNVAYMADPREWEYPILLAVQLLRKRFTCYLGSDRAFWLAQLADDLQRTMLKSLEWGPFRPSYGVFAFCLTRNGNQLSQWRGYCPNGGYSVALDVHELKTMADRCELHLVQCVYDIEEQRSLLNSVLEPAIQRIVKEEAISPWNSFQPEMESFLLTVSRIKHGSFQEEEEWRLVKLVTEDHPTQQHLMGEVLVPHLPVPIEEGAPLITGVTVGPMRHQALAMQSMGSYLHEQGLQCDVRGSDDEYQDWADAVRSKWLPWR